MVTARNSSFFQLYAFLSGISILVYEIVWARQLALIFGNTIIATTIVIAIFMTGLGFGSLYFGRKVDKTLQPLRLFSVLQFSIGAFAIVAFIVFQKLPDIERTLYRVLPTNALSLLIIIFITSLFMIIPTLFMGGTLPILSKALVQNERRIGQSIGFIYGFNTMGSIIGALITGFFLIATFGQATSILFAVIINILLGLGSRKKFPCSSAATKISKSSATENVPSSLIVVAGLVGFCGLAYEILWTRSLHIFLANSTYSLTSILVIFLSGITIGSILFAKYLGTRKRLIIVLAACQTIIGIYAIITALLLNDLPSLLYSIRSVLQIPVLRLILPALLLSFIIAFIPTLCMGISFPLLCKLFAPTLQSLGKNVGKIFIINTTGSIAGSLVAGFLLIPLLGVVKSIIFIAFINLFIGLFLIAKSTSLKKTQIMIIDACVLLTGLVLTWNALHDYMILPPSIFRTKMRADQILLYKETSQGTVIVNEDQHTGIRACYINNSAVCGTTYDALKVVKLLGHLPFFINPDAETALIIGFGIGITSSAVAAHDVTKIDCVEICSGTKTAANFFSHFNNNIVKDPRIRFINDDGRHYVLLAQNKYDVISCDPTHPTLGCNNLYTREYFEDCKRLLNTGGVICQYLPLHKLSLFEFKTLIKTFTEVFPHTTIWLAHSHGVLMGSDKNIKLDFLQFSSQIFALDDDILQDPYLIATSFILDENAVHDFVRNARINTDNLPYLEFFTAKSVRPQNWHLNLIALLDKRSDLTRIFINIDDPGKMKRYLKGQNLFYSSLVYKNKGDFAKSISALELAARFNPENIEILTILKSELAKF
ncbi:MAG: fused MFS/spermidine synthase [bacterium]